MNNLGYYRFPTINHNHLIFVCEDDLWSYHLDQKKLSRLTSNYGAVSTPKISPDGKSVAFVGSEDGDMEVYVMPALGGPAKRLTYLGSMLKIVGWKNNQDLLKNLYILWLIDSDDNHRVKQRYEITHKILDEVGANQHTIKIEGKIFEDRFLNMIHYGDWLSFWCAIAHKTNPSPVDNILRLKNELIKRK